MDNVVTVDQTWSSSRATMKLKRMGRESESLLLLRPNMSAGEAAMWLFFDLSLTLLQYLPPLGLIVIGVQNAWRYLKGMSLMQYHLKDETIETIEYVLEFWFIVEILFYVFIKFRARKMRMHLPDPKIRQLTKMQRSLLVTRILGTVDSVEAFFEQWFSDPNVSFRDLTRAHAMEIVSYALFHSKRARLIKGEQEELETIMQLLEQKLGNRIPEKSKTMSEETEERLFEAMMEHSAMFFTETDITYRHRPLIMYFVVDFLFQWVLAPLRMRLVGRYRSGRINTTHYWVRKPKTSLEGSSSGCLVFLHGIGVGLLPYSIFFARLERMADESNLDIVVVEIPVISQTLAPAPLIPEEFAQDVKSIVVDRCGHRSARFVTHSYGSFCVNWIVTRFPAMVEGLMLIDPAAVLLHHTDVLYNMLYRPHCNTSLDRVLHYIMRTELHFVKHLKREFFWFHNTMFLDSLPKGCEVTLVLSEADQVIPVQRIAAYAKASNVRAILLERCDHGGFLVAKAHLSAVLGEIGSWLERIDNNVRLERSRSTSEIHLEGSVQE